MDNGAWWATVHGVPQSRTRLSNTFTFFHLFIKEVWGKEMKRAGKMPHHWIFSMRGRVRVGIYMPDK